jgi:lipopolysaccharide transport system ATP-binding protein
MSDRDIAVSVRGLSKSYTIAHNAAKHTTLGEALVHRLKNPRVKPEKETFWALKEIEFDIHKGDVVGIIGRNGAGKSTLLKILSRITEPTTGQIDIYGRVGSLLEVGTGFHPELTGRENIYMNGAILGMSRREIAKHFDAIVEFAEVEQFLDTPVKRYSSGMYVRLAFAVAAHLNPEILIVDEVLAVGDVEFQKKCLGKMQDVSQQEGRTVLFVSHNIASLRQLCRTGILLQDGQVQCAGSVSDCIAEYGRKTLQTGTILSQISQTHPDIRVEAVTINGSPQNQVYISDSERCLRVEISGSLSRPLPMDMEALVSDASDVRLGFFSPGHEFGNITEYQAGRFKIVREIELPARINRGEYFLSLYLTHPVVQIYVTFPRAVRLFAEGTPVQAGGSIPYQDHGGWLLLKQPNREETDSRNGYVPPMAAVY